MSLLNGQLLIASSQMVDSFFHQTVVLILAHSNEGAAGLIVNRPTEATVSDLAESIFEETFVWEKPIFLGGPVSGPLVVLHQEPRFADHEVVDGVYSTVADTKVRDALQARVDPAVIAINYSGWGPGQLEREMRDDSWMVLPATSTLVFSGPKVDLWREAVRQVHEQKLQSLINLRGVPENPSWN